MKGIYLLHLKILGDIEIEVGKLGSIKFEKGEYVYVGSDQRNIERRIQRHASKKKKKKWHIDHVTLHEKVSVATAYIYDLPKRYECEVAKIMLGMKFRIFGGFGSSDCSCPSHFFKISDDFNKLVLEISNRIRTQPSSKIEFANHAAADSSRTSCQLSGLSSSRNSRQLISRVHRLP
ncbi:MAG: GIY-YIG nuclease family protein [Aigarchaeota archaeon]|nr:GIY-YIG nuclease family protein [Aigarchaeota archaeon]MDW8021072.1 GIY-YIG nuclease family protein [Nitrososphaerota archaeon]